MATTARNFKHSRISGIALGIPISLYGLSTFVFSSLKARWFEADPTPSRYLTFMAVVSLIANVTAAHFVVVKEDPAMAIRRRAASLNRANRERAQSEAIEMVETRRRRALTAGNEQGLASSTSTLVDDDVIEKRPTGESQPAPPQLAVPAAVQSDEPVFRRFTRDPLAWSLLLGMICFSGPGMAFVNNCGSMVRALSINTSLTPEQIGQYKDNIVATQSFFSFSSRLAIGYLSDIWRTRLRLPRAGLLILGGLLQVYAQSVAMRVAKLDDLYSLAIVTGISMGSVFTLAPTITSETWGAENFGICWGFITLGPAIGGHICNLIFGASWDRGYAEIVRRLGPDAAQDLLQCDRSCFVPAFMSTIRYAYMGVFFFCVVLCLPRIQAIWKRN
ncbi:hypothetical protein FBU59_004807 [Linderina macrospora]|uniref:Uncharacterized protein n=1 Tax=Linderina macrospora TaxID=4868 RepID=A0ACC1J4D4_9FUNG|nr:hypothetical protein FBU59_004807 [Linderina macrospora]